MLETKPSRPGTIGSLLPPGTLLQLMFLRERLATLRPGRFIEIGPGAGHISALLLSLGWRGAAYDLEEKTIAQLRERFVGQIADGSFVAEQRDFLTARKPDSCDLVISCMVIEHLDEDGERTFFESAASALAPGGTLLSIVPASPAAWGIEDEIAGHYRRYTRESLVRAQSSAGWSVKHTAGLTFPISNLLLPISNMLVRRSEAQKMSMSMLERTKESGMLRNVPMKTSFPAIFGLLLNERTMYPLHMMQKWFSKSGHALVLYSEATRSNVNSTAGATEEAKA